MARRMNYSEKLEKLEKAQAEIAEKAAAQLAKDKAKAVGAREKIEASIDRVKGRLAVNTAKIEKDEERLRKLENYHSVLTELLKS